MIKIGGVVAIFISPKAGGEMKRVDKIKAIAGIGLEGDRYAKGEGSWNKGKIGKRQVTLINTAFFNGTSFSCGEARRNIVTHGVELNALIGREFEIGTALMRGVKYCEPCDKPSELAHNKRSFQKEFHDRGGLIAEVIRGGNHIR